MLLRCLMNLQSVYELHPQRKFSNTVLWRQQCNRNTHLDFYTRLPQIYFKFKLRFYPCLLTTVFYSSLVFMVGVKLVVYDYYLGMCCSHNNSYENLTGIKFGGLVVRVGTTKLNSTIIICMQPTCNDIKCIACSSALGPVRRPSMRAVHVASSALAALPVIFLVNLWTHGFVQVPQARDSNTRG